jgi:quinol-cytochrome oxidoreductase complex cytochrome b subunit
LATFDASRIRRSDGNDSFLILLSAILQAPLLQEQSKRNPKPCKSTMVFFRFAGAIVVLGSSIAGVMIPLVLGLVLWMAFPYIDRNPETHPSKRKFAIMFYTFS